MSVLDGVTNFFQFIYTRLVYSWDLWSLLVTTVIFFVIQFAFIYIYAKVFGVVGRAYPRLLYWIKRLGF
jgi:hypothetical protein